MAPAKNAWQSRTIRQNSTTNNIATLNTANMAETFTKMAGMT
ncbi:hypothetical protein HMPREF1248_0294 [Coriobacteriaceae bacterium BV3Ac1]|nr:hypothetical protein HMPREF1248_0294 [Coriobacteriaceae bacterium BV3Ac1]